jgi:hypothetical protein
MVAKAKVTPADVTVQPGGDATIVQNAEQITPVDTVNAQNVGTVNTTNTTTNEKPKPDNEELPI